MDSRPFKRVAVIGAGLSGLVSAKHLKDVGIEDVVVYERSADIGGVWAYDERVAAEPCYPSTKPSENSAVVDLSNDASSTMSAAQMELLHAPPGNAGLKINIPTTLSQLQEHSYREGTEPIVGVKVIHEDLRDYAKKFNLETLVRLDTVVNRVQKSRSQWVISSSTLIRNEGKAQKMFGSEEFDAVIVASGHYHVCRVPDIPGLAEWKAAHPGRVQHNKTYRRTDDFKDQTVLSIGGAPSSTDISLEVSTVAKKVYQSTRNGKDDLPEIMLQGKATRICAIASLQPPTGDSNAGSATLIDGTVIGDIDRIIVCTGYFQSYPFLPDLHDEAVPNEEANDTVLVCDGSQVHNLQKDMFYMPDPTLAFVGVPPKTLPFVFFDYQAVAVAAVFSGRASLPSNDEMRKAYQERLQSKGCGKAFNQVTKEAVPYIQGIVEWVNEGADQKGYEKVEGLSAEWLGQVMAFVEKAKKLGFRYE